MTVRTITQPYSDTIEINMSRSITQATSQKAIALSVAGNRAGGPKV